MFVRGFGLICLLLLIELSFTNCNKKRDLVTDPEKSPAQVECEKLDQSTYKWDVVKNQCIRKEEPAAQCDQGKILKEGICVDQNGEAPSRASINVNPSYIDPSKPQQPKN
ncbi:MAG: hypothetical protein HQK54_03900 [Oligoflexales bacterium]|nr:hypothetical protein [Oligoflexales bacterium]